MFFSIARNRGNFDDGYETNEYETAQVTEWRPSRFSNKQYNKFQIGSIPKNNNRFNNGQNSINNINISHNNNAKPGKKIIQNHRNNKRYNKRSFAFKVDSQQQKGNENRQDSLNLISIDVDKNSQNLLICTQETVNMAPTSTVFFNPVRIHDTNAIIVALKHDKFLREKNFTKSFDSLSSMSTAKDRIISHSSVFELRPNIAQ
ncbi:hypothetical protein TRFO_16010 [Tritrichomonas foetus]|uniref:Uncharacterized protein n=1 Tax=Tritrichomonas foetus TaxID=1144522 RepID=A0A1J4KRB5_9EUKA|nr:hypothetical protein TRFO_16010 [Tritrichomonas foetus]|eukprot:OHT13787.1 hypothetical protein TRFO_16010 [Tritrichomonas foetus]